MGEISTLAQRELRRVGQNIRINATIHDAGDAVVGHW
jgi:hypothetical protein